MAVMFVFDPDADQQTYDAVMKSLGREDLGAPTPDGIIFHLAGTGPGGVFRVVDCWESEEAAGRFYGSETFQKAIGANLPQPPQPQAFPLHRIEVYRTLRQKG